MKQFLPLFLPLSKALSTFFNKIAELSPFNGYNAQATVAVNLAFLTQLLPSKFDILNLIAIIV